MSLPKIGMRRGTRVVATEKFIAMFPSLRDRAGTLTTGRLLRERCYAVRWDGLKTPRSIHFSYLDVLDSGGDGRSR